MRLKRFRVEGLFGLFTHEIEFNLDDRITIIHAPNGYGKTVILKFIEGFFGGSLLVFREHEYRKIHFEMDDGSFVVVDQSPVDPELFPADISAGIPNAYTISYVSGDNIETWNPLLDRGFSGDILKHMTASAIVSYIPHVVRLAPGDWRDTLVGDRISIREAVARYPEFLPHNLRTRSPHPDWLEKVRKTFNCRLIETQRLMISRKDPRPREASEASFVPAVRTYADDLAAAMGRALEESATLSQSLDRTFPNRLLSRRADAGHPLQEDDLRERLGELEQLRVRLTKAGFLDKPDEDALIPTEEFDEQTRRILTEYVADAKKKLAVYHDLLRRIELFVQILDSRFQFKKITIDRSRGFVFIDVNGRELQTSSLSSGEQHELVITYDLIFKTKVDSLILIDEPEISLHIAWQKRFLDDLKKIIALTPIDVVLSTHSPQLIGGHLDLAIQLKGPESQDVRA